MTLRSIVLRSSCRLSRPFDVSVKHGRALALFSDSAADVMCNGTLSPMTTTTTATTASKTNNDIDNSLLIHRPVPAPTYHHQLPVPRTKHEIAQLVQQRVQERDAWLVDGQPQENHSNLKEGIHFMGHVLPKFLQFTPPSQSWLDEHFPVLPVNWQQVRNPPQNKIQMTWLGHSSLLIQVNGCTVVTDPVFSQRCAPTQWNGPKRARQPPCTVAELIQQLHHDNDGSSSTTSTTMMIDAVLISHNHYDHLDKTTVREIHRRSPATTFVVPLGLRSWCHRVISKQVVVHELDWNEYVDYRYNSPVTTTAANSAAAAAAAVDDDDAANNNNRRQAIRITSVPMRHWSSRVGADKDKTLWCGYSLATHPVENNDNDCSPKKSVQQQQQKKILFPGDTAWFDGLDELVGQRYGPFDVAAIPIGAYEPREFMKRNHVDVDEAVRMKDAVQARAAVPIHWGTFPLTVEPWLEPKENLEKLMSTRHDAGSFDPWLIGETKVF